MKEAQVLTHIHSSSYQLAPKGVLLFTGSHVGLLLEPPSVQSPFARKDLVRHDVMHHVSRHCPAFLATTAYMRQS